MGYTPLELLDGYFLETSKKVGISYDQLRYVFALMLTLPMAIILRYCAPLPKNFKHSISLLFGLQIMWYLYGFQTLHSLISSLVVYLLLRFPILPDRYSYKVGIIWSILYIVFCHIYRMTVDYMGWSPDFTAPQMVISIKMSSYCFSVHDAIRERAGEQISERQKKYAIRDHPSLLEFLGYTYFFPGFLAGPAVEYADYSKYMDLSMFSATNNKIPSGKLRGTLVTIRSLVFMGLVAIGGNYGSERVRQVVAVNSEATKHSILYLLGLMYAAAFLQRCKYYLAWGIGEACCIFSGVGFSGFLSADSKKPSWDRAVNVRPLTTETSTSLKIVIDNWNIGTERWLRHYIYERLEGTPLHGWRKVATFMMSAFWHGLYPGYYMTFFFAALHEYLSELLYKKLRPLLLKLPKSMHGSLIYDLIGTFLTIVAINYCFQSFMMLTFNDAVAVWNNTYWIGHWPVFIGLVILSLLPTPKKTTTGSPKDAKPKTI